MKKLLLSTTFIILVLSSFSQKKKGFKDAKAFYIGVVTTNSERNEFDKYIKVTSDSLKLVNPLQIKNNYGVNVGVNFRNGNGEFEAGISYLFSNSAKGNNNSNTTSATLVTQSFDFHFGYSQYVLGPLFIGSDLGVISNDGKFTIVGGNAALFEKAPESNNPFKGYAFFARPKVGLFFNFKKNSLSGLKLTAFYDMSISKYNFYENDIFETRLKSYNGETKSSYNAVGIHATFLIEM